MLKSWTKLWCILKPGVILLYKSDKAKVKQFDSFFVCYAVLKLFVFEYYNRTGLVLYF